MGLAASVHTRELARQTLQPCPMRRDKDRLTDKEKELREAGEVLRAAAGTASTLTHTAAGLQHHSALLAVAVQRVGEAFMQMGSLEQAAMHVELVEATTRFGEGCAGIAGAARAAVESQSERIQVCLASSSTCSSTGRGWQASSVASALAGPIASVDRAASTPQRTFVQPATSRIDRRAAACAGSALPVWRYGGHAVRAALARGGAEHTPGATSARHSTAGGGRKFAGSA